MTMITQRAKRLRLSLCLICLLTLPSLLSCSDAQEPSTVSVPVKLDSTNQSSYVVRAGNMHQIDLKKVVFGVKDLQFTVAGEAHTSSHSLTSSFAYPINIGLHWLKDAIVPTAHAHPGHFTNGDVTGELLGSWVFDYNRSEDLGKTLGNASLLPGTYTSMNFSFHPINQEGLTTQAIYLSGSTSVGSNVEFAFAFTPPEKRQIIGVPVTGDTTVEAGKNTTITLHFTPSVDSSKLFNDIDFKELAELSEPYNKLEILTEPDESQPQQLREAYLKIKRQILSHDFYTATFKHHSS